MDAESAAPNFHFGILAEGAFALIPAASSDIHSLEMGHGVQYLHFDRDHSGFHPTTEEPLAGGYFSPGFHLAQTPHLRYRLRFGQAAELRLRAGPNWQATEDTSGIESKWGGDFQDSAQGTVMREWRWSARIPEKPRASPWRVGAQPGYILGRRHLPMAYSEILAGRVAEALRKVKKVETKKMMGGLCFMVEGKMALGILAEDLMVRLDPDVREKALKEKGCRERGFTGLPMKAFVFVDPQGTRTDKQLRYWVDLALEFNPRAKSSRKSR